MRPPIAQLAFVNRSRDVEQTPQFRIRDGVPHGRSDAACTNQVVCPQRGEVLRDAGLLGAQPPLKFAHRQLAIAKNIEDTKPQRVRERLKKFRLKAAHKYYISML